MAYMKSIVVKCSCGRLATHEVLNNCNSSYGQLCRMCAESLVKTLKAEEAKEAKT